MLFIHFLFPMCAGFSQINALNSNPSPPYHFVTGTHPQNRYKITKKTLYSQKIFNKKQNT